MNHPPFLTELLFAPGQHPHSIGLIVVPTLAEMNKILESTGGTTPDIIEAGGGPPRAACYYDFESKTKLGFVIFAEEALDPKIVVHELTHAAQNFVITAVMSSAAVQAKTEEEQHDYFDEALAQTVEALFDQAFNHLFNWLRKSHVL